MKTICAVFVFALSSAASAQDYHRQQSRAADQAYEAAQASISGQAAAVSAWAKDAQTALFELGRAEGVPDLPELESRAADPKTSAALEAADRRFVSFLNDEREVRASAR